MNFMQVGRKRSSRTLFGDQTGLNRSANFNYRYRNWSYLFSLSACESISRLWNCRAHTIQVECSLSRPDVAGWRIRVVQLLGATLRSSCGFRCVRNFSVLSVISIRKFFSILLLSPRRWSVPSNRGSKHTFVDFADIYPPFPSESSKGSSYKEKVIKAVWISALVGGLLLAIITAVVCIFVCRRRRKRKNRFHHSEFSVPYIQGIVNKKGQLIPSQVCVFMYLYAHGFSYPWGMSAVRGQKTC